MTSESHPGPWSKKLRWVTNEHVVHFPDKLRVQNRTPVVPVRPVVVTQATVWSSLGVVVTVAPEPGLVPVTPAPRLVRFLVERVRQDDIPSVSLLPVVDGRLGVSVRGDVVYDGHSGCPSCYCRRRGYHRIPHKGSLP